MKRRFRYFVFAVMPALFLLLVLETASSVFVASQRVREWALSWTSTDDNPTWDFARSRFRNLVPDPYCGFRMRPSDDPQSRRPPEPPFLPKKPGEVRVLAMGDSVCYGVSLSERDAWPARLQVYLNENAGETTRFEVYNGGVLGHQAAQCKRLLQTRYMALEPDIVLWAADTSFADAVGSPNEIPGWRLKATFLVYRSRFLYLLSVLRWSQGAEHIYVSRSARTMKLYAARESVFPMFADWLAARGVDLVVGMEYLVCDKGPDGLFSLTANGSIWRRTKLPWVEAASAFPKASGELNGLFLDPKHFNEKGADLYARNAAAQIREMWTPQ